MKAVLEVEASRLCVDVAVPLPISGTFTYLVPAEFENSIKKGVRVLVPFRNREIIGYVVESQIHTKTASFKSVIQVLDRDPVISDAMLALTRWIGTRYSSSWGEAIENALPKWVKYGKKADRALAREIKNSENETLLNQDSLILTPDQKKAMEQILQGLHSKQPKPILLYGVTGSGKSEIYIRAIREVLAQKKTAICLVPEIALTEQLRFFFAKHFGDLLEVLHSKLNDTERFLAWKRLESGEKKVVLGPRSAVFAPVPHLGLIVIDEEHEGSYKQETTPRYHAREVAVWRAAQEGALLVLGSATPSLESMYRTENNEFIRIELRTRIDERAMPQVTILDLKGDGERYKKRSIITPRLASEIEINLQRKEGILLLLNRRGFSTHVHCPRCGTAETCQSCQISLTFHQEDGTLLCHYCNYQKPVSEVCSQCGTATLRFSGFGTEKVESEVALRWPQARVARLDADSARKKGMHEKILKDFRNEKIDILIGTQMIAKGFDFPHVTLVGVVLADVGLMLPDFRSSERTFQLLTQVAGRAGRGKNPGRVFIQTFSPDHPSIRFAKEHDYASFYRDEMPARLEHQYPPYSQLINFIIRSHDENKAYLFARQWRDLLRSEFGDGNLNFAQPVKNQPVIIGPSPLPFYKLRGHFRWHVMMKTSYDEGHYQKVVAAMAKIKKSSSVAMAIDVDPVNIL